MRCGGEVCAEHLANSAPRIPINMKLAQVKLMPGDIYKNRPAEKTCAVNSHRTSPTGGSYACEVVTVG